MLTKGLKKTKAKPFTFLYGEKETDFPGISKSGQKIMDKLMPYVGKHKIQITGPCVWAYRHLGKGRVLLRAGFPVAKGTEAKRGALVSEEPAWECRSTIYAGAMDKIPEAWDEFIDKVKKKGLKPKNINREVYHKWIGFDSADNVTELQVQAK
jgi:hypothetical protein